MIISVILATFYFCHNFYQAIRGENDHLKNADRLKISLVISAIMIMINLAIYFLAKKHIFFAKYFSNIETIIFIVNVIELSILSGDVYSN
jgi:hypothetical protein